MLKWRGVFPGQGSQFPGMGQYLWSRYAVARMAFEEASDAVGVDFKTLCFNDPRGQLGLTEFTQPALLVTSYATYLSLKSELGIAAEMMAGHSVGEYSALLCADFWDLPKSVELTQARGQAMQMAVPQGQGGMAALIGLTSSDAVPFCEWVSKQSGSVLEAANFNSPEQTVVSGQLVAIEWAQKHLTERPVRPEARAKLIPLKVSAPFHCSLMKPATQSMHLAIDRSPAQPPTMPIIQNVSARAETEVTAIKKNLIDQIEASVRWVECFESLSKDADFIVEVGPGKVLAGLAKKISTATNVLTTHTENDFDETLKHLTQGKTAQDH